MNQKVIQFNLEQREKEMPEFRSGDVVKVHRKIQEAGKERTQVFEGMIIAVKGKQSSSPTITVRKVSNGVGVEIIVPVFSPMIERIELMKRAKVIKSKLYYIREKTAKSLRFKFKDLAGMIAGKKEKTTKGESAEEAKAESAEVAVEEKEVVETK